MKPGARIAAAIEILSEFDRAPRPIERILKDWGKNNRFAGSGDRRAIAERVYDVMRARAALAARMASEAPRALVLASLEAEGTAPESLFDGEGHNPPPLTEEEKARLAAAPSEPPRAAQLNCPEWLLADVEATFGAETDAALLAMNARAPLDLRANTLKGTPSDLRQSLESEGVSIEPISGLENALRIHPDERGRLPNVENLAAFKQGLFEIQDGGSQFAVAAAKARPGEIVIDLCAGGGGKSLALAAALEGEGKLFAADIEEAKLANLKRRLHRAGVTNAQVRTLTPFDPSEGGTDPDFDDQVDAVDLVFLDVPCSGTGTWRRHPDARWRLTPEDLARYQSLQASILRRGARLVRPGGRLVYATCSILASENEMPLAAFLKEEDFSLLEKRQLSPHSDETDGFFYAVMERGS